MQILADLQNWHCWLSLGIILIAFEMLTSTFYLACFGLAALLTAAVAHSNVSFTWQLSVFILLSAATLVLMRPFFRKVLLRHSDPTTTNTRAMLGSSCLVVDEITNDHQAGRVKIYGEEWRALSKSGGTISSGTLVRIDHVDGATVTVSPL